MKRQWSKKSGKSRSNRYNHTSSTPGSTAISNHHAVKYSTKNPDEEELVRGAEWRIRRANSMRKSWNQRFCGFINCMLGPAIFEDATYIFNHILLGTQEMAFNREELLMTGITHICNCAEQIPNYFEGEFVYMKINLVDKTTEEILPHFQPVSNFLKRVETLGGRALIHCVAGVSRSPALLIAHLMIDKKMRLYDAYRFVKKKRSTILPNTSFRLQLAKYEIMLFGKSSVDTTEDPEWNFFAWNEIKNSVRLR